ncbi:zinc knuckle CX2CX4HX4C containing protein, partial [Tanacetum coccineum]
MEQGFLNRSSKSKNKKKDLSDSIQKKASLLTDLAKKVKNIEGKMLGKDGLMLGSTVHEVAPSNLDEGSFDKNGPNAITCSYVGINSHDVTSENKEDEGAVKIMSPGPLNSSSMEGTKRDTSSSINIVKVNTLINEEKVLGAHVALPLATINEICAKFDNTLYGYFIGSWLAFPIVRNYVRNTWAKYGYESVIIRDGFFLFKFSSQEGLNKVLHRGPCDMCLNPWGSNTYARVLIELSVDRAIMDSIIVAVPFLNGNGHSLENHDVEYEWRPLRCSLCNVFGHDDASRGNTSPPPAKEGNNMAVDKPCEPSVAAVNEIPREIGNIHETRSVWERFKKVKKTSIIDSESDKDEVYSPDYHKSKYVASTSGEFTLEDDDLDCYDGYEAQLYDIPDEMQKFCDNYDIRLKSRV